jgi:hypothetical protein
MLTIGQNNISQHIAEKRVHKLDLITQSLSFEKIGDAFCDEGA